MWNLNILYQERFSATFIYHIFFAIIRLTIRSNNILWTADSKQDNPEKKCHCQMCGNKVWITFTSKNYVIFNAENTDSI